jgi:hypothetical protein
MTQEQYRKVFDGLSREIKTKILKKEMAFCDKCFRPHGASSVTCRDCLRRKCVKCNAPMCSDRKHCNQCMKKMADK